ncbi:MAG TPA: toll/interleukin-1 receptor domain-containing protein [Pyrinomonadaceae bacterium]|nr:toll/interleukin-1 receptor domain-containing protein [Pyrinomonadaceae bacterium]
MPPDSTPQQTDGLGEFKYWAFISYSHRDEEWAQWLHKELETYRVPRRLVGRQTPLGPVPRRLFPVFRDREELPGSADLGGNISGALTRSRTLVVVCSPRSAISRWVNEEIKSFKALGRDDRVLCLIVDGEPNATDFPEAGELECFPPALRFRVRADGTLTEDRVEPIAADAREGKDGRENSKLKILAGILGVGYDELRQREQQRVRRQRLRLAAVSFAAVVLLVFGYVALADLGAPLPGGESVRTLLDRHDLSVLRPTYKPEEIERAAPAQRRALFDALASNRTPPNWMKVSLKPGARLETEVWSQSQALTGMFRTREASGEELRNLLPVLWQPFEPGIPVERGGRKLGWAAHQFDTDTVAEPALWTAAALASAVARPNLLTPEERERALAHLAYTQEVLKTYRPLDDGGWNMFPGQVEPDDASPYTTALALLMLLEVRRAHLPWEGSNERRDGMLKKTAQYLIGRHETAGDLAGWRGTREGADEIFDGLTLKIYSLLLRAHREADVHVPDHIMRQIPRHLSECAGRPLDYPIGRAEFSAVCVDETGRQFTGKEGVGFLWHPWAISAAEEWLQWASARPEVPEEERVRVRRALGHMIVELGPEAARRATAEWTFIAAETLYGLSTLDY